jgi:OPA family glycerol-3-phosphate transporter-like MFS transporter 1/2
MFQATGWPGVVSVMANWFGKGRRGLIMGLWNSHTSLGNILGSLIAGAFVQVLPLPLHSLPPLPSQHNWGLSFTVPGLIIAGMGFTNFLLLVPRPDHLGFQPEEAGVESAEGLESEPLLEED